MTQVRPASRRGLIVDYLHNIANLNMHYRTDYERRRPQAKALQRSYIAKWPYYRGPEAFLYLWPALPRRYADHRALPSNKKCDNCSRSVEPCFKVDVLHAADRAAWSHFVKTTVVTTGSGLNAVGPRRAIGNMPARPPCCASPHGFPWCVF